MCLMTPLACPALTCNRLLMAYFTLQRTIVWSSNPFVKRHVHISDAFKFLKGSWALILCFVVAFSIVAYVMLQRPSKGPETRSFETVCQDRTKRPCAACQARYPQWHWMLG